MADNAQPGGTGDTYRTKDRAGVETQIIGLDVSIGDAAETLMSAANPMPVEEPNGVATGNITAANANMNTGTATANSTVLLTVPDGHSSFDVYLSGTFSATTTLVLQESITGTDWFATSARVNLATGLNEQYSSISSDIAGGAAPTGGNPSNWKGSLGGVRYLRVTASAYTAADNIAVTIVSSAGVGGTFLLGGVVDVRGAAIPGLSGAIAAAGTGTVGPLDVSRAGNVTFVVKNTVAGTPFLGAPVLVFEQSDDSVSWGPLTVVNNANMNAASTVVLAANTANVELIFEAAVESVDYMRVRVTTGPTTAGMTILIRAGGQPFSPIVNVGNQGGSTGTTASTASTATANTTLLVANPNRRAATIFNDSTSTMYVLLGGGTESTTVFTTKIAPGGYYEVPFSPFTGRISGHWVTANGSARITEVTA